MLLQKIENIAYLKTYIFLIISNQENTIITKENI